MALQAQTLKFWLANSPQQVNSADNCTFKCSSTEMAVMNFGTPFTSVVEPPFWDAQMPMHATSIRKQQRTMTRASSPKLGSTAMATA